MAGHRAGCVHRAQPQRRADVHRRRGARRRAVPRRVADRFSRATPMRCSTRRWPPERGASRCSGVGRTSRSWPAADRRDDAGRPRLGQSRPHQRRGRAGTGRGRAVPELLRRRRAHVRPHRGARGGAQHLGVRAGLPAHRADLAPRRSGPPGAIVKLYFGGELEFGLPPTPTVPRRVPRAAGAVRACRGRWRCSAATSSTAAWPSGRSVVAGTCESGWRTGPGAGEPSNAELLRAAVALVERLGPGPGHHPETRRDPGHWRPATRLACPRGLRGCHRDLLRPCAGRCADARSGRGGHACPPAAGRAGAAGHARGVVGAGQRRAGPSSGWTTSSPPT